MDSDSPFLSIIIPTYNSGNSIKDAVQSIIAQDFKSLEVLVLDGLSTDNTLDIIRNEIKEDRRFRISSQADEGIYDAMNKGIRMARGEWVYFLGSDDTLINGALSEILPHLTNGFDIIYGDVQSSRFGGRYDGGFDFNKIRNKNICHQAIFFRKALFDKVGNFNLKYRSHADWDHNMRWLLNSEINNKYVEVVVANYADGGFSSTNIDLVFGKERALNYLKYGIKTIPRNTQIHLFERELKTALKSLNFKRIVILTELFFRMLFHFGSSNGLSHNKTF